MDLASFRAASYGAIGAQIAIPPFFVISEATNPIRRMLISRCSRENPNSEDKCLRTMSPSNSVTGRPPISRNLTRRMFAIVDLPEPERPVRSEEHTSELQSPCNLVCRLLLEKKK